jgi:hypothetical protein
VILFGKLPKGFLDFPQTVGKSFKLKHCLGAGKDCQPFLGSLKSEEGTLA